MLLKTMKNPINCREYQQNLAAIKPCINQVSIRLMGAYKCISNL